MHFRYATILVQNLSPYIHVQSVQLSVTGLAKISVQFHLDSLLKKNREK